MRVTERSGRQSRRSLLGLLAGRFVTTALIVIAGPATGNDGFYQGAGTELVPVKSHAVRVKREQLVIRPVRPPTCADVVYQGKRINFAQEKDWPFLLPSGGDPSGLALGPARPCGQDPDPRRELIAQWTANAIYVVEARESIRDAVIGFPVPTWGYTFGTTEGLEGKELPAVIRFQATVDGGAPVTGVTLRELRPVTEAAVKAARGAGVLGYVWTATFEPGRARTLGTSYEFGVDSSAEFYSEYCPASGRPWFLAGWTGKLPGAERLRYFLTPIRTWAEPPPDEITVRIELPEDRPVTAFVPLELAPSCVDEHALHFRLKGVFPDRELSVSYPGSWSGFPHLKTKRQWDRWMAGLGDGDAKVTCRLRDSMMRNAEKSLKSFLRSLPCVRACESRAG